MPVAGDRILPPPGGVLVRNDSGEINAAVSAVGGPSEDDEACVHAVLESPGYG